MNNKNLYCQLVGISTQNAKQSTQVIETIKANIPNFDATDFSMGFGKKGGSSSIHIIPRRSHAAIDLDFTSVYVISESQEEIIKTVTTIRDLPPKHGRTTLFWSQVFPLNARSLNTFSHAGDLLFGDPRASVNFRLDLSLMTILINNPKAKISHVREFDAWLSTANLGYDLTRSETNTTHVRRATSKSKRERNSQGREIRYDIAILERGRAIVDIVDKVGVRFSIKWDRRTGEVLVNDYADVNFSIYDRSGNPQPNVLLRDAVNIANLIGNHVELGKSLLDFDYESLFTKDTYFI